MWATTKKETTEKMKRSRRLTMIFVWDSVCVCVFVAYFAIFFFVSENSDRIFLSPLFNGSRRKKCPYNSHLMVLFALISRNWCEYNSSRIHLNHNATAYGIHENSEFEIRLSSNLMKRKRYCYCAPHFDQGWKNLNPILSLINISE